MKGILQSHRSLSCRAAPCAPDSHLGGMQLVARALKQATTWQNKPTQTFSTSQSAPSVEGRDLDLHLGCLPLVEQRFTISSGSSTVKESAARGCNVNKQFVFVAPKDVDQVMDIYMQHDMLSSDPYWCRTWPSAIALASAILAQPSLVAGKRVADLGAGLGLAGLAAALSGAAEVVLLDREPLALQCGLLSALATAGTAVQVRGLNTTPPGPIDLTQHPSQYTFSGSGLDAYTAQPSQALQQQPAGPTELQAAAGDDAAGGTSQQHGPPCVVRGQVFDWTAGPEALLQQAGGKFDVVLACDVLYEDEAVGPIAALVPNILKPAGGRLMLADPPNRTAHHRQRFVQLLADAANSSSSSSAGGGVGRRARAARLVLEEGRVVEGCRTSQLDPEMAGGLGGGGVGDREEVVPVQLMVFRASLGTDTVGIK